MKPTIGRIVHYVSHGTPVREDGTQEYASECRAAIVTAVEGEELPERWVLSLTVLSPEGMFFARAIPYSETGMQGGTWHWLERSDEIAQPKA